MTPLLPPPSSLSRDIPFFFVDAPLKNLQNRRKTALAGLLPRHHSGRVRSKYFKKSEKKACQASKTSLILTAKPNQTNGETNDKKRTEHVRILPHGSRSRRRTSFPHRCQRLRAGPGPGHSAEATTERVIVTGSYIPTAETESALPVTVYTAEVLRKQGANTPVEGLRQLPSFVGNTLTENDSNGGDGSGVHQPARYWPGQYADPYQRPPGVLISLTSTRFRSGRCPAPKCSKTARSAIYGSDAVAGVVNFILLNGPGEKPYEGAELFALYGNTTDTDAHVRQIYLRGGVTGLDGKVSIAAAGEYYSRANLFSRDREISTTGDTSNNPTGLGFGGLNNNSPTFAGRVSVAAAASTSGGPQPARWC